MKKFTLTLFFGFCLFAFAVRAQVANTDTTDVGVLINGVVWATRNVDAPGTFVKTTAHIGMRYQYNIRVGWRYFGQNNVLGTDGSTVINHTPNYNPTWEAANDPCPNGWRIPTIMEAQSLIDAGSYIVYDYDHYGTWCAKHRVYGSSVYGETDNTISLNIRGIEDSNDYFGSIGNPYWCNTANRYIKDGEYDIITGDILFNASYPEGHTQYRPSAISDVLIVAYFNDYSLNDDFSAYIRCVKANMDTIECTNTLNVFSNDNDLGYVQVVYNTQPILSTLDSNSITFCGVAELIAIPKENAVFTGWQDGLTFNPYFIMVMQDISITANFTAINTGIEDISVESIKVFPNPATSELIVNDKQLTIKNLEILDLAGRIVEGYYMCTNENSNVIINVSTLSEGLYLLKINTDKGIITEKFIKK